MTFHAADYHPSWPDIRRQILDQAGHACEWCGAPNGTEGDHDVLGRWWPLEDILQGFGLEFAVDLADCGYEGVFPRGSKPVRIVLTIAHACQDKRCIDCGHLFALCQRCHLNHDRDHHIAKAAITRRDRRIERASCP